MSRTYLFKNHLEAVSLDGQTPSDQPVVEVISSQELVGLACVEPLMQTTLQTLATVENTYLDVFPGCLVGSFAVPQKEHLLSAPACFAFYLDKEHLVFLDESDTCAHLLDTLSQQSIIKVPTVAHCLFEFMRLLTKSDLSFLAELEERMEDVEESIIDQSLDNANHHMLEFRRQLLHIDTYYQQLVDMTAGIAENENKLLSREEARLFQVLDRQAERLLKRTLTLKEYSMQLRELYQTQIDIQQNKTMKFFAVITTLFAPLTLLTGWFGMNFKIMPGIDWTWGYLALIFISITIVVVEIVVFKRKKWL